MDSRGRSGACALFRFPPSAGSSPLVYVFLQKKTKNKELLRANVIRERVEPLFFVHKSLPRECISVDEEKIKTRRFQRDLTSSDTGRAKACDNRMF